VISALEGSDRRVVFNSRQLEEGDVFAATVLRPGRYNVMNSLTNASASLDVAYPGRPGPGGDKPQQPVQVTVGAGFSPAEIVVQAAQGQVYTTNTPSRILIELVEPYDRSSRDDRPRYRRTVRRLRSSDAEPAT
jgi:hypothetical protein